MADQTKPWVAFTNKWDAARVCDDCGQHFGTGIEKLDINDNPVERICYGCAQARP